MAILIAAGFKLAAALAPQFVPDIDLVIFNLTQDQPFYFDVNATDPTNDSFVYTYSAFWDYSHTTAWSVFAMNNLTGIVDFTPGNDDVTWPNFHDVLITVIDNTSRHQTVLIKFNVSNVNDPPEIIGYTPELNASIHENDSMGFTFDYNATDPDTPYGDVLASMWLEDSVNKSNNQTWVFRPGFCEPSNRNITLVVSDLAGLSDAISWNISIIDVNRMPLFNWSNPINNITWEEDMSLINNISLDAYFSDQDDECIVNTAEYSVSGNHSIIISISRVTGHNVSFTAPRNWFGVETINFTRFDGYNYTISNNIVLNVTNVPDLPMMQNITNKTLYAFAPFTFQVNASSPDNLPLTYYDNTTIFDISPTTGLIYFVPDGARIGNFSIRINVSDGTNSTSTTFNMEIIENNPPSIVPPGDQTGEQESQFTLVVDGSDPDNDSIIFRTDYSLINLPMSSNATSATFRYTPHQQDVGLRYVRLYANDSHGANVSTVFMLNITDVNNPPVLDNISSIIEMKIGKLFQLQLNATDPDEDILGFTHNSTAEEFPHFSMDSLGMISFTPNSSDLGNHSVNLTVYDNSISNMTDSKVVLFVVTNNRPPYIQPLGQVNATEDAEFFLQINATEPDGDEMLFYTNSSFNFSTTGAFSFVPNKSDVGFHNISINVTDSDGGWYNTTFMLYVRGVNHPPEFDPPLQDYLIWDYILEDNLIEIYVNATDQEGDDLNFSSEFIEGSTLFNITKLSSDRALINFTPIQSDVGNYSVRISVADYENMTSVVINFSVQNFNDAPVIDLIYPYGTPLSGITIFEWANKSNFSAGTGINASEGSSIFFNHTSYDVDNINLSYRWYYDGRMVSTESYWHYPINYTSNGIRNVTLIVDDTNLSDSMYWNVSVADVNRAPIFGQKIQSSYPDFSSGSAENVNISDEGLRLSGDGPYTAGVFTSSVIDMGRNFRYGDINLTASVPNGTYAYLFTSTSSSIDSGWSAWSEQINITGSNSTPITSLNYRYIKYMLNLTSDGGDTPLVSSVVINYGIENETQIESYYTIENSSNSYWFDLDDFFYDLDSNNLTFSVVNSDDTVVTVWIESWNGNHVGMKSHTIGTSYATFTAIDPAGANVSSNVVSLTFTEDPSKSTDVAEGSSGGSTTNTQIRIITQQVPQDVDKYVNLDIIVPEAMTTYQNSTVVSPIRLVNNGDKILEGITLTAETNASGVGLAFTQSYFGSLAPGEQKRTNLIISSVDFTGSYDVTVIAKVKNPEFSDSAKILMATLEKGEVNKTQLMTKITFTRDLLLSNPECIELNEMLKEAQIEINNSNYQKANDLIENTIRYCRYLLVSKESLTENPTALERLYERIFGLTSKRQVAIYGGTIGGVFLLLTLSLMIERIRKKREIKNKEKARKGAKST